MAAPIRVLLVTTGRTFATRVAEHLPDEDFDVLPTSTAAAGLDRLAEEAVDCVVAEHRPPELDGLELLADLRDAESDLPFVLIAESGSEAIVEEALSRGATDCLVSGTTQRFSLLANRIRTAVWRRRSEATDSQSERRLESGETKTR